MSCPPCGKHAFLGWQLISCILLEVGPILGLLADTNFGHLFVKALTGSLFSDFVISGDDNIHTFLWLCDEADLQCNQ